MKRRPPVRRPGNLTWDGRPRKVAKNASPCPDCEGTGYGILPRISFKPTPLAGPCPRCDGSGQIGKAR
jgi:DnaJ-class molecular chaperone